MIPNGTNQGVTWSVSGTGCMGASCGTIDTAGKYTAPATVPNPNIVSITARSVVNATNAGTATVTMYTGPTNTGLEFSVAVAPNPSGKFGKFAYVANYGKIAMFTINAATGALTAIGTVEAGLSPSSIAINPSGRFAYVTNAGRGDQSSNVSMYAIDAATGTLTSTGTVAAGANPRSVALDPSGKFAYVGNLGDFVENQCDLSMYTVNVTSGSWLESGYL